jgi:hypothetical protein
VVPQIDRTVLGKQRGEAAVSSSEDSHDRNPRIPGEGSSFH